LREKECIDRIRHLENRHQSQMMAVLVRNNTLIEALLHKEGITIPKTPIEGLDT
jgi:hypothetical protein